MSEFFINHILNNENLREIFDYNELTNDTLQSYSNEFDDIEQHNLFIKTKWLYEGNGLLPNIIGVLNDQIIFINENIFIMVFCGHFQDIPFEIYRRNFDILEYQREEYLVKLNEYEQWLKDNNIPIDPDRIYHDTQGNIFDEYFEYDYE